MNLRRKPNVMTEELLNAMNTKDLLGYLKQLHQCEVSFEKSDMETNEDLTDDKRVYFKETEKWQAAYKDVKVILGGREHIKKEK